MFDGIILVAITGGPGGGKSTFLAKVAGWLQSYGISAIVISETATEIINAGVSRESVEMLDFEEIIFKYQMDREESYRLIGKKISPKKPMAVLCDRGILDGAAYIEKDVFAEISKSFGYSIEDLMNRYKMVIHLTTTAIGAEELYTLKNNHARSESIEEAIELDKKTEQAWLGHPNRVVIDNSTGFDIKMLRALQALAKGIDMPKPTEIERKFKFVNFDQKFIPPDAVMVRVKQDYLKNEGTTERRIRLAELNGLKIFFYTKNEKTGEFGAGNKTEDVIRSKEYYNLRANERDSNFNTIKKTRYNFFYLGKKFELDVYKEPISFKDLVILKVELAKINEEIEFPSEWKLEDITGMEKYDSINLAKKK